MTSKDSGTPDSYLENADVWTVIDLIAAEFQSDLRAAQCFDLRLVRRAIELAQHGQAQLLKDIVDENNEAHQVLNTYGAPKVDADGRILGLRDRLARLRTPADAEMMRQAKELTRWILGQYETVSLSSAELAMLSILMGKRGRDVRS